MQNKATELFSDWADIGKDEGMAEAHSPAVNQILEQTLSGNKSHFNFIDAGCGNGCLLYTSPSPRDRYGSRMPSSA